MNESWTLDGGASTSWASWAGQFTGSLLGLCRLSLLFVDFGSLSGLVERSNDSTLFLLSD